MAALHYGTKLEVKDKIMLNDNKGLTLCGHWISNVKITKDKKSVSCIKCNNILNSDWPKHEGGYKSK